MRAGIDAGHPSRDAAVFDTRWHSFGAYPHDPRQRERRQLLPGRLRCDRLQAALAHEERLVHRDRPLQAHVERRGQAIGVLAQDQVPFFQPQQPLRLDAKGPMPCRSPELISASHSAGPCSAAT